ncbi:MAG: hypothetical protein WBD37_07650 [Anderseniella sp.]
MDLFNFKDVMVVFHHNIWWLLAALLLGLIVGWMTCRRVDAR